MRPAPFVPESVAPESPFVVDRTTGREWHRVFHRPLYADTDRSQVVYHANYLRYFELGRATLMRDVGYPYREIEESGVIYPIIDLGMTFHAPVRYDDPIWVNTRPAILERVKVSFDYVITHTDTGVVVCKGHTRHCATLEFGRPCPVDDRTVALWQRFMDR